MARPDLSGARRVPGAVRVRLSLVYRLHARGREVRGGIVPAPDSTAFSAGGGLREPRRGRSGLVVVAVRRSSDASQPVARGFYRKSPVLAPGLPSLASPRGPHPTHPKGSPPPYDHGREEPIAGRMGTRGGSLLGEAPTIAGTRLPKTTETTVLTSHRPPPKAVVSDHRLGLRSVGVARSEAVTGVERAEKVTLQSRTAWDGRSSDHAASPSVRSS